MPKNPAPLVDLQNVVDEIQEALIKQDQERIRQLQTDIARKYDQFAAADSLRNNGMSRRTRDLLRRLGYRVIAL